MTTTKELTNADIRALGQADHLPAHVQDEFDRLLGLGNAPAAALMFASRQPPGVKGGDRVFCEQARHRMETMNPMNRDGIIEIAKKAGINIQGKFYCGGLGAYDDQAAWVSCADDVLAVARERDLTVTGAVNHEGSELLPPKSVPLAEDIIQDFEQKYAATDPKLRENLKKKPTKTRRELREKIIAKHGYKPPKN